MTEHRTTGRQDGEGADELTGVLTCLMVIVLAALPACRSSSADRRSVVGGLPHAELRLGGSQQLSLNVELALTPDSQTRGLMEVQEIPDDYGMVFLWSDPGRHSFHMKNTRIPLDIAWWNEDDQIVDIQTMTPCELDPCRTYSPAADHIAAVEVNAGLLSSKGIELGDPVELNRPAGNGL